MPLDGLPLRSFELRPPDLPPGAGFPYDLPAFRGLGPVRLEAPVTFLVGENGSGKSTLLEGLALAAELPTVGSGSAATDPTLEPQRRFARGLELTWSRRSRAGFFLRAEDFFGWVRSQRALRRELQQGLAETRERLADASEYGRRLAEGPFRGSLAEMERRYGEDPDAASHGESFLSLFKARFRPDALHLLDEPEAALSPWSQLALMLMIAERVEEGGQFVVATHSPLLLALPGAAILSFDSSPLAPARWEELESVRLYRDFLQAPERFLRHLWE